MSLVFKHNTFLRKYGDSNVPEDSTDNTRYADAPYSGSHHMKSMPGNGPSNHRETEESVRGLRDLLAKNDTPNRLLNIALIQAKDVEQILEQVERNFNDFAPVNALTAIHRLSALVYDSKKWTLRRDRRFRRLMDKLCDFIISGDPVFQGSPGICSALSALAKIGVVNLPLYDGLLKGFSNLLDIPPTESSLNPVEFSMSLWSFARSRVPGHDAMLSALDDKKNSITVKVDNATLALLDKAAGFLIQYPDFVARFDPQQVSNTSWSFSRVGCENTAAYEVLAARAIEIMPTFNPVNVSMIAFAFARAQVPNFELYKSLACSDACNFYRINGASYTGKIVSNLIWAFATLPQEVLDHDGGKIVPYRNSVFSTCISVATARRHIWTYAPGQLLVIAKSLQSANPPFQPPKTFYSTLADVCAKRKEEFRPDEIATIGQILDNYGVSPFTSQGIAAPTWLIILAFSVFLFFYRFP
eukprot:GEMP01023553.1.p1 GENE.GEMP01023553.1~~GEMP01023553.1.p1  ORF type:complete len:471 (+),score=51.46 GEMP01023553.1:85-1497(+)